MYNSLDIVCKVSGSLSRSEAALDVTIAKLKDVPDLGKLGENASKGFLSQAESIIKQRRVLNALTADLQLANSALKDAAARYERSPNDEYSKSHLEHYSSYFAVKAADYTHAIAVFNILAEQFIECIRKLSDAHHTLP